MSTKQKSQLRQLAMGGITGAIAGLMGYASITYLVDKSVIKSLAHSDYAWENPTKIAIILFAIWGAWVAHELGHLISGLAQGFKFHLFIVGLLGVRRNMETDDIEWFLNRDVNLAGGIAATIPMRDEPNLRQKFALIVAMGPVVSLLGAILGIGLSYAWLPQLETQGTALLRIALNFGFAFGAASLLLFAATTIPGKTGTFFTDRARFFRLIGGGKAAEIEQAILTVLAKTMGGEPYSALDKSQLEAIASEDSTMFQIYARNLLFRYYLDINEPEAALRQIQLTEPLIADQPALFKNELLKELALAYALIAKDAEKAQDFMNQIKPALDKKPNAVAALIKSAIAVATGANEHARELARAGLKLLPESPTKSEDKQNKRLLEQLLKNPAPVEAFL
ncbi:MAG: M50 family metallopeptidase [Saprospiraceae bacterium]|nr:M50 family metallopeptidase [Saprospiraceae bacterium]MDZ4702822.1 M50 family metallopeptidase [Saprospiraceae bacterium]